MLTLHKPEKVYRDSLALVDELKERVLAVGARFTKVYFTDRIIDFNTMA
jgi:hypothetical protein